MNNEEELKDLIKQNGFLIYENSKLKTSIEELRQQNETLFIIIKSILNKNGDKNE